MLISFSTTSVQADIIDDINSKINEVVNRIRTIHAQSGGIDQKTAFIKNRANSIFNNTNGVQNLVTNVRGVTSDIRSETFSDIQESLETVQNLLDFLRERRENATFNSSGGKDEIIALIESLKTIMGTLQDNPDGMDLSLLTQLINILPDGAVAILTQGLTNAGIDAAFIERIDQAALDLIVLLEALELDQAEQFASLQPNSARTRLSGSATPPVPGKDTLPNQTQCDNFNSNRLNLKIAANGVLGTGGLLKLSGAITAGFAKTVQTQQKIGIHGYIGLHIKTTPAAAIGKIIQGLGDGLIAVSSAVSSKLKHCEILYHQAEIMQSNHELLEEICALTRYSSAKCQAIRPRVIGRLNPRQ